MTDGAPQSGPSPITRILGVVILILIVALLGKAVFDEFVPPVIPPGPVDPDDDDFPPVADEFVSLGEKALLVLDESLNDCLKDARTKQNRVNTLRIFIPRAVGECFKAINEKLTQVPSKEFARPLGSLATGFQHGSDRLRRSGKGDASEHVAKCGTEFSRNFRYAAKLASQHASETEFHDHLQQVNFDAVVRLMDSLIALRASEPFYGYRIDDEHREELEETGQPLPALVFNAPEEIDPRGWHRIENQGAMGSCQGHANSSVCEFAYYIARREVTQFSPLFAYYSSQKIDGIHGSDCGSTIAGGLASAKQYGSCPLEVMPYPRDARYQWGISQAAYEAAKPFKIERHIDCRNYDQVFQCLASGQGGVEIGIRWPNSWMHCSGVLEHFDTNGGGGHAVCFLGYSTRKDRSGRNYLWLANSWGPQWGAAGWAEVSPVAVDEMFRHADTVMIGMSDMKTAKPRDVSWIGRGSVFLPKTSLRLPFERKVNVANLFVPMLAI